MATRQKFLTETAAGPAVQRRWVMWVGVVALLGNEFCFVDRSSINETNL